MSRRKLQINKKQMRYERLNELYTACQDVELKLKLLAILQTWDGKTSLELAAELRKSDSTIRDWIHRYNAAGVDGLQSKRGGNKDSKLTAGQKATVKSILQKSPRECGFNRSNWSMKLLAKWIRKNLGVTYKPSSLYDVVHGLGFTLQRPKKQSRNANPELKEQFKKELKELVENSDENTIILYEDEAIVTTEPTIKAKWALKGQQPIVSTESKGGRSRKVIFGAVSPETGDVIYSTEDQSNTDTFKDFLK